ncbi:MAG TPA: glycine--tRNA ligase subunit beta, partial [Thermoanaerobaculia bacterium]|nr:glycine--tRNA ligase subunit beta [Thermoanaerobaculia bacterium]
RQEDRTVEVSGPPVDKAVDADGRPTKTAEGFARAQGVAVTELRRHRTPRGEVLLARRTVPGRLTKDLLAEITPRILASMTFPKMMRWGSGEHEFVRPVHGVVAVFGGEVVPMTVFGVRAGNRTVGHRLRSDGEIEVTDSEDYARRLRRAGVEPDGEERAAILLEKARTLAAGNGGSIETDADLIPTLADLVEWPGLVCGAFDPAYLELPEEILVTTMRTHQKYLPIRTAQGLTPNFLAVMDHPSDPKGLIVKGNEWVINARLSDARFFFDEDVREPFSSKMPRLSRLFFHDKLGDYLQKTGRVQELTETIGALVTRPESVRSALEAARLSKIDLTTEMVREFTDLQGIVGGIYARREGATEEVWKAIYDQYRPVSADDEPPRTETGAILSAADRVDTLAGFFGIGLVPTGSKDPYGLRRAAQGLVAIVLSRGWRVDWSIVFRRAVALHGGSVPRPVDDVLADLWTFFADRIHFLFEKRSLEPDVVASVLAAGSWDFADLAYRAGAIADARRREGFRSLSLSVKRIRKILAGPVDRAPDPALFREPAEHALASDALQLSKTADTLAASRRYPELIAAMVSLAPALDRFFDDVLVNAPEPELKANRQALLAGIQRQFGKFADISEIVVEK